MYHIITYFMNFWGILVKYSYIWSGNEYDNNKWKNSNYGE